MNCPGTNYLLLRWQSSMKFILVLVFIAIGYSLIGSVTGLLWQRLSNHRLSRDDLWAIATLWWAFLPLGLALMLMNFLQDRFGNITLFS